MTSDKIIILVFGLGLIGFVYWYFFMKKEKIIKGSTSIDILVKGGYQPSTILIPYGKKTKLNFKRVDESSCLEEVVLSDFKIKKFLPLNEVVVIEITPLKKGNFDFSCGMGMFHGKLIVE